MSDGHLLGVALRRVVVALERLSAEDMTKLSDPAFDLEIKLIRRRAKDDANNAPEVDMSEIIGRLTAFTSRELAATYLASTIETKKTLEALARHLDIPIIKSDKVEVLRDRVIEATVGARLRSEAIKGTS